MYKQSNSHGSMSPKQLRTLAFASERLFGVKSWLPNDSVMRLGRDIFSREVRHDSKHVGYLSASGIAHFKTIVATIDGVEYFRGRAAYSDIWTACKKALAEFMSLGLMPETAEEFLKPVRERIEKEICTHSFVVSMYGVQLKEVESLSLGRFRLVRPTPAIVFASGISDKVGSLPKLMKQMGEDQVWFVGAINATYDVAKREFFHQARLAAGLLAISAASTFEQGAQAFRIGAVASPEEARTPATVYLSWVDGIDNLGFGKQWRQGQDYEINAALADQLQAAPVFATMLRILQQSGHNKLEGAIVRAVYWFSDAHKDTAPVMRLVKFWSCIESFFSQEEDITKSVSIGTAAVLTFGSFGFVPRSNYVATRKRLAALYAKRSKAVHDGMHDHVEPSDLADLSQWAAWLILSMAEMSDRYTDAKCILAQSIALDEKAAFSGT